MRTLSIILTIGLIIPIGGVLFSAYSVTRLNAAYLDNKFLLYQLLSPMVIYLMAIIIAAVLNTQRKYVECSVMCGTIISIFLISTILNFGLGFAAQWLR